MHVWFIGLQALGIKAQFDAASGNELAQEPLLDQIKSLAASHSNDLSVQLTASQMLLSAGQVKEALQCVFAPSTSNAHSNITMEHGLVALQIYLRIDRLDLARQQLTRLRASDEDSILTQLASVYVNLATGSTGAAEAVHTLNSLSEQYGPSPMLLNLVACALMQQGDYVGAEMKLQECIKDFAEFKTMPDTLINLICCTIQQNKPASAAVQEMKTKFPKHPYTAGLERVVQAFDREALKYMV